jgi:hypothetical protein
MVDMTKKSIWKQYLGIYKSIKVWFEKIINIFVSITKAITIQDFMGIANEDAM